MWVTYLPTYAVTMVVKGKGKELFIILLHVLGYMWVKGKGKWQKAILEYH
jgi:hypothetical protein